MMLGLPVESFINPPARSREHNAITRATDQKPDVCKVGEYENELYFRVQSKGRDRHCVICWYDSERDENFAKCDCEAHYVPISGPTPCLHIAAVLIWMSSVEEGEHESNDTPRAEKPSGAKRRSAGAK